MVFGELLVREEAVAEYLGVHPDEPVPLTAPHVAVNVGVFCFGGRKYADVADLVRMLRTFAQREGHPLLSSVADQLSDACGLTRR